MTEKKHIVNAPLLTPVDESLEPDPARLAKHMTRVMADGCHRVTLFGTTGEANSFSVLQRTVCLEALIDRGAVPDNLVVGTGCPALADTVALTRHAFDRGVRDVLILPPYYYKNMSEDGLFASYAEVMERLGERSLRVYLYHYPKMSGVPVTAGLIERLLQQYPETFAGIKDSSGDRANLLNWLKRYPELAIFPGAESQLVEALEAGAAGVISAVANVNASAIRELLDRWSAGERDLAALEARVDQVRRIFESVAMAPALKTMVAQRYKDSHWKRVVPPLQELPADAAEPFLDKLRAVRPDFLK